MSAPAISVVIPSWNRHEQLLDCLRALDRQTLPGDAFEVIVVDDGSSPALDEAVCRLACGRPLRLIHQENGGPAAARNRGLEAATGAALAFTDDDCLPEPHWLESMLAAWRATPDALIGGSTYNGLRDDVWAETSQLILDMVYEHFNADPDRAYFFASNNMLCGREACLAGGGFDPTFRIASEDRDLCDRWRAARRPLRWVPDARIEHRHRQTWLGFLRMHYRYGRGACAYWRTRRARGTGTMREDLGFQAAWIRRLPHHLGRQRGWVQRLRILTALAAWQVANAVGFAVERLKGGAAARTGARTTVG